MDNYESAKQLIEESISAPPHRLAEINVQLTAIKSYYSEKLDNILVFKADKLQELQEGTSVASAKVKWNASKEGKDEIIYRGILGRIKDQVSVIKSRLNVAHDEAFGQY